MDLSRYEEVASDADDFRFGVISILSRRSDNRLVLAHVTRAKTSDEFDEALQSAEKRKELSHPNLLEFYELIPNEKAMEVLQVLEYPNTDLFEASEQLKYPAEQLRLLRDITGALAYLESQGSSHGDVRPEYIHYSEKGKFLLVDRLADQSTLLEHQLNVLNEENEIFTSPEVMRVLAGTSQRVEASPAQVDLFSLGMTLTEVVFGEGALQVFYDRAKKTFREEAFAKFLDDLEAQYEEQENGKLGAFIARRLLAIDPSARRTATETHSALLEIFAEELRLEKEDFEPRGPKLESGNLPSPQVSLESPVEQAAPVATHPETETSKNKNVFKLLRKKQDNEYLYHERAGGLDSQEGSVVNRQSVNNSVTSLTLSTKPQPNEVVVEDRELHSEKNVFKTSNFEELQSDLLEKSEAVQTDNLAGSEPRNPKTSQSTQNILTNADLKRIQANHSVLSDKNLKSLETSQKTPIETNLAAQESEVLRSLPLDDVDSGQFIDESTPHRPLDEQLAPQPANESPRNSPAKLQNNYSLSNLGPSDSKKPFVANSSLKAEDFRQPGESNHLEHGKSGSSKMLESMNETLNRVSGTHEVSPSQIDSQLITFSAEHINQRVEKVNLKRIFSKNAVPATGDSEPEISNNASLPKSMTVLSLRGENAFRAGTEHSDGQTQMVQSFKGADSGRGISSQNASGGYQGLTGSREGIGNSLEANEFGRLEEVGLKSAISFGGSNSQFLQASGLNELQEISNDIGNFKRSEKDLVPGSQKGIGKESSSGPFSEIRGEKRQSLPVGKETGIESVRASQDSLEAAQRGGQKEQVSDKNRKSQQRGVQDAQTGSQRAVQDAQTGSQRAMNDAQTGTQSTQFAAQQAIDDLQIDSQKGVNDPHSGVQSGQQDVHLANKKKLLDYQMDSQKGIQDIQLGSEREGQNSLLGGRLGEQNTLLGSQKGIHGVQSGQQDVHLANKKKLLDFQMDSQKGIPDAQIGSERGGQDSLLGDNIGEQDALLGSQKGLHGVQSGQQDVHLANKKKLLDYQMDSQKGIQDVEIRSGSERGVILSILGNQQGITDDQFGDQTGANGVRLGNKNVPLDGITDNQKGNHDAHFGIQEGQQDAHLANKKKLLDFQIGSERGGQDVLLGSQKGINETQLGSQKGVRDAQTATQSGGQSVQKGMVGDQLGGQRGLQEAQQGVTDAQRGIQDGRSEIQKGIRDSQSATQRGVQDAQTGSQRAMQDAQTGLDETTLTNQRGSKDTQQDLITNVSVHTSENQKEKLTERSEVQSATLHQLERTQKDELKFTMEGQRDSQSHQLESQKRTEAIHQESGNSGQARGGLADGKEGSAQIQGYLSHGAQGELKEGRDGNIGSKIANFAGTNADLRSQAVDSSNGLTESQRLVRATLKGKITSVASELTIPSDRLVQPLSADPSTHLEAVDYADSAWKERIEGSEAVRLDSERVLVDSTGAPRATGEAAVGARGCAGVQAGLAQMFSKAVQTDKSFLQRSLQPLLASAAEESRILYSEGQAFPAKLTKLRHTCRRKLDFSVQSIRTLMTELEPALSPSTPQPLYRVQATTQPLYPSAPQPLYRIEATQVSHFITGAPLCKAPYPLYQRTSLRRVETPSISSTQFKKPNLDQSRANRYVVSRSPARRMQI